VAIEVLTTDCTALSDSDYEAMADLATESIGWEVGILSKQAEEWVLASQVFDNGGLAGFMLTTLERIGGTPALVIGVASVARTPDRAAVLEALMHECYHKALMAFPDEDVIVATRLVSTGPLEVMVELADVRPWPETRANGEERAWGRRLSKRFGAVEFNDRTMIARGDGEHFVFDHESAVDLDGAVILEGCDPAQGQYVIGWGWAMAEFLEGFQKPSS